MKNVYLNTGLLILLVHFSSCVGSKKFKGLEEEKSKIEQTLMTTKQELSEAKRELNKFKHSSSSTSEEQSGTIQSLRNQLDDTQKALDAAQGAAASCQEQLHQLEQKNAQSEALYKTEVAPLMNVKKNLQQQHNALKGIKGDIDAFLAGKPEVLMKTSLDKDELVLTLEHDYFFASSGRNLSTAGRLSLYEFAEVLKKYPDVYIDIVGHMPTGGDTKDNWKNSTRKTLSLLYTLTAKEVLPERIRVIGYGEYQPLASNESPEGKKQNSRTEIILRFQNTKLLKLIPLK